MTYAVALCGLTARDSRLLEIVVNRASSGRHAFHAAEVENTTDPRVVIVDAGSPRSMELYETLCQAHPGVISVTISDHGMAGDTRYRIQRKSLLLHVMKVLDDLADSAEAAMRLLEHGRYDLAFLDVVMPGTDGYELCRRIKHNSDLRGMPVLMLTSRSSPFDRARGALSGCDSYLVKPITWDIFSQAVDKALLKHFRNDRAQMIARGYRL